MWDLRVESYQFIQKVTDGYNFSVLQFTTEAKFMALPSMSFTM